MPADAERNSYRLCDLVRKPAGVFWFANIRQNDGKFVASHACDRVRCPDAAPKAFGDAGQQYIADGVTESVVDRLEVINIEQQYRQLRALLVSAAPQRARELIQKERTITEPSEGVVIRQVMIFGVRFAARGYLYFEFSVDLQQLLDGNFDLPMGLFPRDLGLDTG